MKSLTHKQVSANGGKKAWKNKTKEERSKIMKERWIIRRLKKAVNND
jgi:hypothetical protein